MTEETKGKIGSSFDDFLKDEGIYEEVSARAIKRVLARKKRLKDLPVILRNIPKR